jgi:hypothetical protein
MKTRAWFRIIILVVILVLALGSGLTQASPQQAETASIQAGAWWFTDYVDQPGDVGAYASIAFDPGNGTPWISYYNAATTALRVAHRVGSGGNCGPDNTWYCETVDNTGSVGTYSSIDVHPNTSAPPLNTRRIGVAYYDAGNGALKFAEYSCLPLPCTWRIVTVQDADYVGAPSYGQYASLKYDADGDPQIAFYVSSAFLNDELHYAYPVTSGGNCGVGDAAGKWQCDTVDSGDQVGQFASLGESDFTGVASIAYYDGGAGDLKYAYYIGFGGNCGTGNAWYCSTVDGTDGSNVGRYVSFHAPANSTDRMQFAYYDWSHGMLKYAVHVGGSGGNCGPGNSFQCDTVEAIGGGPDKAISLAVDGSNVPVIAYRDAPSPIGPPVLAVAQPLGLPYGNCGPGSTWQCATVDPGSGEEGEAGYVSIALDPDDLAMIAYSEQEQEYDTYDLKIAYQPAAAIYLPVVMRQFSP